ncbi:hypothetical protein SERLADRAFT_410164 [Serpula lacrymans var. lacrymans S7.9]|uniref:Uncharacterized protein n=1 Tax=Serpula lacrymans var. lacrymans (strain S7.9) TaxID=578457 RepID=F8P4L1_SERL9|nr:uncharacterized protein SERLADRAFT_410164 [Serpula lacrymans var. lacrymans S7.9]EGO21548.1 hypothetical protein SERLADRAFT_410164 [Serpula lacrymans var. lacrymans S7.9]
MKDLTNMKEWVRSWLYNHSGNKKPRHKVARHGKYLSLNQVLNIVKKKEVEKRMWDLYRVKPGQSDYIGKLQSVLKAMLTELSEEELAELKVKCEEWYIDGPLEKVRQNLWTPGLKLGVWLLKQSALIATMSKITKPGLSFLARYNPTGKT